MQQSFCIKYLQLFPLNMANPLFYTKIIKITTYLERLCHSLRRLLFEYDSKSFPSFLKVFPIIYTLHIICVRKDPLYGFIFGILLNYPRVQESILYHFQCLFPYVHRQLCVIWGIQVVQFDFFVLLVADRLFTNPLKELSYELLQR